MSSPTSPVGSGSSNSSNSSSASALSSALNITPADFLQLITTQLQDQNPLQPTDPTQFLGQLEQMSEVSSMQSMQSSMTDLTSTMASSQMANGAAMIGQTVLTPTPTAQLDSSGGSITGAVAPASGAKSVTITVTNSGGALVDSFQVTPATSGLTNFTWNGKTSYRRGSARRQPTRSRRPERRSDGHDPRALLRHQGDERDARLIDPQLDVTTENGTVPLSSVVSIL